jgi:hypothetical protein
MFPHLVNILLVNNLHIGKVLAFQNLVFSLLTL